MSNKVSGWPLIAPKEIESDLPAVAAGDAGKVLTVNVGETGAEWAELPDPLPAISSSDEGKVLTVVEDDTGDTPVYNAEWAEIPDPLPIIAAGDAGKVLKVNAGETGAEWAAPSGGVPIVHADANGVLDKTWNELNALGLFVVAIPDAQSNITLYGWLITIYGAGSMWAVIVTGNEIGSGMSGMVAFATDNANGYPVLQTS